MLLAAVQLVSIGMASFMNSCSWLRAWGLIGPWQKLETELKSPMTFAHIPADEYRGLWQACLLSP